MAVVAQPQPFHSKLDFWGQGTTAAYPLETPESMTDIMSYQYPPPPPNGADMGMAPSGYMPDYSSIPPPASGMDMRSGQDAGMPEKDRRDSLSKMKLKRSLSTPNVRPQQPPPPPQQNPSSEHAALGSLAAEKRRNKLGYHRTSVACGHCRRRKIRCIPSPADVQGRCVNCIRLKKECSFYPVDQQPPADARQKSAPRTSNMAPPPMKPAGSEPFSPEAKMPSSAASTRTFDYGHPGMTNWMSADASPSSSKPGDLSATWRTYPQESPITPAFSPYTPHAPPSATWGAGSETPSREDMNWSSYPPPPPRSMSFGSESMSSHHSQQYPPISQIAGQGSRPYDRKSGPMSADLYPPPIATSIPGVESVPGTTLEHNVSLSAGAVPPPNYGTWQSSYPYAKPSEGYGGWYGEGGAPQQMGSEEQVQPPSAGSQPPGPNMYYGGR